MDEMPGHGADCQRRLIVVVVVAALVIVGCLGLGAGFVIGNIYGENAVCEQAFEHITTAADIPICVDPWW